MNDNKERKGLFPQLSGLVDIMYKIWYVDDSSEYLKKFVKVELITLAVLMIVGVLVKNIFTLVFGGFLMLVNLVIYFANNYKTKGFIQFKVGRGLVILVGFMTLLTIFMTVVVACFGATFWEF